MAEPPPPITQTAQVAASLPPGQPPPAAHMPHPQQGQPHMQQGPPQATGPPPLFYMDFVPTALSQGGAFSMPQYERFE